MSVQSVAVSLRSKTLLLGFDLGNGRMKLPISTPESLPAVDGARVRLIETLSKLLREVFSSAHHFCFALPPSLIDFKSAISKLLAHTSPFSANSIYSSIEIKQISTSSRR